MKTVRLLVILSVVFFARVAHAQNPFTVTFTVPEEVRNACEISTSSEVTITVNGQSVGFWIGWMSGEPGGWAPPPAVLEFPVNPGVLNFTCHSRNYCSGSINSNFWDQDLNFDFPAWSGHIDASCADDLWFSPGSFQIDIEYRAPILSTPWPQDEATDYFSSNPILCDSEITIETHEHGINDKYIWQINTDLAVLGEAGWVQFAYTTTSNTQLSAQIIANALGLNASAVYDRSLALRVKPDIGTHQTCAGYDRASNAIPITFKQPVPTAVDFVLGPSCPSGATGTVTFTNVRYANGQLYDFNTQPPLTLGLALVLPMSTIPVGEISTNDSFTFSGLTSGQYLPVIRSTVIACSSTLNQVQVNASAVVQQNGSPQIVSPSCQHGANGTVTVNVQGGSGPYDYIIAGGSLATPVTVNNVNNTRYTFPSLGAGTYSITVTDNCNDLVTFSAVVQDPAVSVSISHLTPSDVACASALGTGQLQVGVSNGQPNYTYSIAGPSTASSAPVMNNVYTFANLSAGSYAVTVVDALGCQSTGNVSVDVASPMQLTTTPVNPNCFHASNGRLTLHASGGAGRYEYSIDGVNYFSTNTFSNLSAGTSYLPVVRDPLATICRVQNSSVILGEPSQIQATIMDLADVDCYGGNNGTVTILASGGTPSAGYSYTLVGGPANVSVNRVTSAQANFTNLLAGNYTLITTDGIANCFISTSIDIDQPDDVFFHPVLSDYNASNVSCANASDGSIQFTTTGGAFPHTISVPGWSSKTGNQNDVVEFENFAGGDYVFTVTYNGGACQKDSLIRFVAPPPLMNTLTAKEYGDGYNVSCNGHSNGVLSAEVTGGTMPYTYTITPGGVPLNYVNVTTDSVGFENLPAGLSTVTVTDANSCLVQRGLTLTEPEELVISQIQLPDFFGKHLACNGDENASVSVFSTGGSYPKVVTLNSNGQTSVITTSATAAVFSALGAGTYTFFIEDEEGCTANGGFDLLAPAPLLLDNAQTVIQKPDCFGYRTGSLQLQANGGIAIGTSGNNGNVIAGTDYHYQITYQNLPASLPFSYPVNQDLEGDVVLFDQLIAGTYAITISDQLGCTATETVIIETNFQVNATATSTDVTCKNDNDGSAQLSVTGGTGPYSIHWLYQQTVLQENLSVNENEIVGIQNLQEGLYDFMVSDNNGCTFYNGHSNFQVEGPAEPLSLVAQVSPVKCKGDENGVVILEASGGWQEGLYQYGADQHHLSISNTIYEDLSPGLHTYYVSDNRGCIKSIDVSMTEPASLTSEVTSVNGVSCHGKNDGNFSLTMTGGTVPYNVSIDGGVTWLEKNIFESLQGGSFTAQIKDANGCSSTEAITINEPTALVATITDLQNTRCRASTGSATCSATGGTTPYTFSWYDTSGNVLANSLTLDNRIAGTYHFEVIDTHNCTASLPIQIINTNDIIFDVVDIEGVKCFGQANGEAKISIDRIQPPYSIAWDRSIGSDQIINLTAGEHQVTLTDANDCEVSKTFSIPTPDKLAVSVLEKIKPKCHGDCDGSLEVTTSGGTGSHSVTWLENGVTSNRLTGICAGRYALRVNDKNNCEHEEIIELDDADKLVAGIEDTTYHICQGQQVQIDLSQWKHHAWSSKNGFASIAPSVALSEAGHYNVVMENDKGCEASAAFDIVYSNELLKSEFLILRETYVGDTVVCIDLSSPDPDKVNWKFNDNKIVSINEYGSYNELVFLEPGEYEITLVSNLAGCVAQQTKSIIVLPAKEKPAEGGRLGYSEKGIKELNVFPNPNSGIFSCEVLLFEKGSIHLRVLDLNGKILTEHKKDNTDNVTHAINIAHHPAGVYWLIIEANEDVETFRILVR